jgi:hypothetical protein
MCDVLNEDSVEEPTPVDPHGKNKTSFFLK